jgi:hypothetical protein
MSRRGVKRCQRLYKDIVLNGKGKSHICGELLPRISTSNYCPSCESKLESIRQREESDKRYKNP